MMHLPTVTLLAVDTRTPALAVDALRRCMNGISYGRVLLLTDRDMPLPDGITLGRIPTLKSAADYSALMIKGLLPWVATDHVLIAQWDGFVVDPARWDPAFLSVDYIGAPWPQYRTGRLVGNGGFSLRSRKLLMALQDPQVPAAHPEDVVICREHGDWLVATHGIRFAEPDMAARFASERSGQGPSLGIHGLHRFGDVMPDAQLLPLLDGLPDSLLTGKDGKDLGKRLLATGRLEAAARVVQRRDQAGLRDFRSWKLRWHLRLRRCLAGWSR